MSDDRGFCDKHQSWFIDSCSQCSKALEEQTLIDEVQKELARARSLWPAFNSAHEGFAVLNEEVDELWEHVRMNQKKRDLVAMKAEARQVAAMALRFALDVCDEKSGRK